MNLEDFVRTALTDIIAGVASGREAAEKHGALIGSDRVYGRTDLAKVIKDRHNRTVSSIEFDIALAEAGGTDTKGGIGVFLGAVGLGSQGASHKESSSYSRIKFSVPVVFPGEREEE